MSYRRAGWTLDLYCTVQYVQPRYTKILPAYLCRHLTWVYVIHDTKSLNSNLQPKIQIPHVTPRHVRLQPLAMITLMLTLGILTLTILTLGILMLTILTLGILTLTILTLGILTLTILTLGILTLMTLTMMMLERSMVSLAILCPRNADTYDACTGCVDPCNA